MKKYLAATALIVLFLAVFIPLASTSPDGLEKTVEIFGVKEKEPFWTGLLRDYSVSLNQNSYVSTLLAGIFGVTMVLLTALLLGRYMAPKNSNFAKKND